MKKFNLPWKDWNKEKWLSVLPIAGVCLAIVAVVVCTIIYITGGFSSDGHKHAYRDKEVVAATCNEQG